MPWTRMRPYLIGVLLSAAGIFLGYNAGSEIARLLGGEPGLLARLGKGLVWGGVMGALQWPLVRDAGVPPLRFLMASAIGFAVGYPLGQTFQAILTQWNLPWTGYEAVLATFGLCLGLSQWWVIRQRVKRASLWIAFSTAGWLLWGQLLISIRDDMAEAGIYGLVAGIGLAWLAQPSANRKTRTPDDSAVPLGRP